MSSRSTTCAAPLLFPRSLRRPLRGIAPRQRRPAPRAPHPLAALHAAAEWRCGPHGAAVILALLCGASIKSAVLVCAPGNVDTTRCREQVPPAHVQVYGLPTLQIFRDGALVPGSSREGALGLAGILSWLEAYEVELE